MHSFFAKNSQNKNHSFSAAHFYQQFFNLEPSEIEDLNNIQRILNSNNIERQQDYSKNTLGGYDAKRVYRLAENSSDFEKFCQHDDYPHAGKWAEQLKGEHIYYKLFSLDGENAVTLYDHYVNAVINKNLKDEMEKTSQDVDVSARSFWILEGCKHHSYYALTCRAQDEIFKIKSLFPDVEKAAEKKEEAAKPIPTAFTYSDNAKEFFADEIAAVEAIIVKPSVSKDSLFSRESSEKDKVEEYKKGLDKTLDTISNLYLTLGHLYAAKRYYELGNFFSRKNTEEYHAIALGYYNKAAEKFFAGEYLMKVESDNVTRLNDYKHLKADLELVKILTQGQGLAMLDYASPQDAASDIMASLPTQAVDDYRKKAKTKMDELLETREKMILNPPSFQHYSQRNS